MKRKSSFFLVVIAFLLLTPHKAVNGLPGTTLSVFPAQNSVALTGTTQVNLAVTDSSNLMAYDIVIEYDADIVNLVEWVHGDYLSNLAIVYKAETAGSLHLACTQLATAPVSGSGDLLTLTFQGESLGTTSIAISQAEFFDGLGALSNPTITNGLLTVVNVPTATQTATLTSQPTATFPPTATSTPLKTATPTPLKTATSTKTVAVAQTQAVTSGVNTPTAQGTEIPVVATTAAAGGAVVETGETAQTPVVTTGKPGIATNAPEERVKPENGGVVDDGENNQGDQPEPIDKNSTGNTLFWVLLVGGGILLVVLVLLVIWIKQKEKNKLREY